eukprot:TRINITY_DN24792_c0_g1_i2.p1 TRINITY_DN24792_c0_g1~~TRINITY_DN24792_c0_g1_i2.p1  ORF type:complete len:276 (+),score=43.42 TRINITY_DN24792_c0_g1_i2:205-1032(+)
MRRQGLLVPRETGGGAPYVEVDIEIEFPPKILGSAEASPFVFDDIPAGVDLEEVQKELVNPHSVLRLRLKEKLEKAITDQIYRTPWPKLEMNPPEEPIVEKKLTWQGELGLRMEPTCTGGAYMIKGPTPAQAPFWGGFKHESVGRVHVSAEPLGLPPGYKPYRDEHEQPYGRESPSSECPAGKRRPPPSSEQRRILTSSASAGTLQRSLAPASSAAVSPASSTAACSLSATLNNYYYERGFGGSGPQSIQERSFSLVRVQKQRSNSSSSLTRLPK